MRADRDQIQTLKSALGDGEPRLESLNAAAAATAEQMREAEARLAAWQAQWDAHTKASAEASQAAEVERTRLDYLDARRWRPGAGSRRCSAEKSAADFAALNRSIEQLAGEHDAHREKIDTFTAQLSQRKSAYEEIVESERTTAARLNEARTELQRLRGRLASLEALQHAALGQEKSAAAEWLTRHGLDNSERLGEVLEVAEGWDSAVETVLAGLLEGVLVAAPIERAGDLSDLREADMALLASERGGEARPDTLAAQVRGPAAALALLGRVRTAQTLDEAQAIAAQLGADESVVTRAGEWIARGCVRVRRGGAQAGMLGREREIHALQAQIAVLHERVEALGGELDGFKARKADAERARDDAQRELYVAHRRVAELAGQLQSERGKIETAQARLARIDQESAELEAQLGAGQGQTREARGRLEQAVASMGELEQQRQHLDAERRSLLEAREEARANAREAADTAHLHALSIESKRSSVVSLEQALQRMHAQLAQLEARKSEIAQQLAAGSSPLDALEAERQTCLNQRLLVDRQLVEARKALEAHEAEFRGYEQERHRIEHLLAQKREAMSEQRLAHQGLSLRAQQIDEAIRAAGHELAAVLEALPAGSDPAEWQEQLTALEVKIKRLEPVNLAAISEHEEQSQRKAYLDAQLTDLNTALETLESAIRKIDHETRQRFKETFDRVNGGLQELFPRLFGGGHAYLELTGDSLLDSGVSIMARPPGKRVSNITLLSGGEKALSAVALVFSIFRLNPAPFCLLDEVDAPLDEANIGRFSQLVTEMSERVQFLFVTHNKGTMEAAQQLCGVTMREPGVSRLVQVDLAEAAKLAGAA